jgi:hypothetical protein
MRRGLLGVAKVEQDQDRSRGLHEETEHQEVDSGQCSITVGGIDPSEVRCCLQRRSNILGPSNRKLAPDPEQMPYHRQGSERMVLAAHQQRRVSAQNDSEQRDYRT